MLVTDNDDPVRGSDQLKDVARNKRQVRPLLSPPRSAPGLN